LCYELVNVQFHPKLIYYALSYTWGEPSNAFKIVVNNQEFPVRHNLYQALSLLNTRTTSGEDFVKGYLWADAICIDQHEDEAALAERSSQIRLMKQIYENLVSFSFGSVNPTTMYTINLHSRK
jgi:hypothetical protein